jgi:hypothetical protein
MNAKKLYDELSGNAWKLAARSTLDADDIRQELYLMCMEVAEGRSTYSPLVGGVHEYIMGRLWGLVRRWPLSYGIEDFLVDIENKNELEFDYPLSDYAPIPELHAPSVDNVLEQQVLLYEQGAIDIAERHQLRERLKDRPTLAILIQTWCWSYRDAATFCGTNYPWIQRYANKWVKRDQSTGSGYV